MATWRGSYPSAMYDGLMDELLRDLPDDLLAPLMVSSMDQSEPFAQRWRIAGARFGAKLRLALMERGDTTSQHHDALELLGDFADCIGNDVMIEGAYLVDAEGAPGEATDDNRRVTITHNVYAFSGNDHGAIFIVPDTRYTDSLIGWCWAHKVPYTVLS